MRDLINIVETGSTQAVQVDQQPPHLAGTIDVAGLATLLDKVDDLASFQSGIASLQAGTELTAMQKKQMAMAFISLLDATPQDRQKITTKLQNISMVGAVSPAAQNANAPVQESTLVEAPRAAKFSLAPGLNPANFEMSTSLADWKTWKAPNWAENVLYTPRGKPNKNPDLSIVERPIGAFAPGREMVKLAFGAPQTFRLAKNSVNSR